MDARRVDRSYRGQVTRVGQFLARRGLDLLIVLAAVEAAVSTMLRDDLVRGGGAVRYFEAAAVAGVVLTLLARHRFPFGAPAATWLASAALTFLDGRLIVNQAAIFLVGMGASVLLGNQRGVREARLGLVVTLVCSEIVVLNDPGPGGDQLVTIPVLFGVGWLVGYALRERTERTEAAEERAERAERERESAARLAVAEERARIARELHDVVAHAVSVIVLQVGAVRHRMPASAVEDREALQNVEQAGRTALAEMRRLLTAMRDSGEELELAPHPGIDDLEHLVDEVRGAGLDVRFRVEGDPVPLSRGLEISAYRIVQEGLTNALRHAGGGMTEVTVVYAPDELRLGVRDDGRRDVDAAIVDGQGHGLIGIRERVKLFGGTMEAGPAPGGGFLLRARMPLEGGEQ
jgi:signal transduction histidine kinase